MIKSKFFNMMAKKDLLPSKREGFQLVQRNLWLLKLRTSFLHSMLWCDDVLLILSKSQCRNKLTLTYLIFFPGRTNYYPSVLLQRRDEMSTTSHRWLSASSVLRHFLRINNVPSHNFVLFRPSIKYWFKCLVFFLSHILRIYNFSTYDIRW